MILDRLENAAFYRSLSPRIAAALDYLRATDFSKQPDGRRELDGDRLVAIVQRYRTKPLAKAVWEAHRRYLDVQYVVEGEERIGYAPVVAGAKVAQAYDDDKDFLLYDVQGDLLQVPAGSFAIFAPPDIHSPGLVGGSPPMIRDVVKVVMKCRLDG